MSGDIGGDVICKRLFGSVQSRLYCMQLAVKTSCNHIFCLSCLQHWRVHGSCPTCGKPQFTFEDLLQPDARQQFRVMLRANWEADTFDKQVDKYLLAGRKEAFDSEFARLLNAMNSVATTFAKANTLLHSLIPLKQATNDDHDQSSDGNWSDSDDSLGSESDLNFPWEESAWGELDLGTLLM